MDTARLRGGPSANVFAMIARPAGVIRATQIPLTTRVATSIGPSTARPPAIEATAKTSNATRYTRRRPNLAASRPPNRIEPPKPRANPLMTRLVTAGVRCSPAPIDGIPTTIVDTSRASSNMLADSRSNSAHSRGLQDIVTPKWTPVRRECVAPAPHHPGSAQQRAAAGVDERTGDPAAV